LDDVHTADNSGCFTAPEKGDFLKNSGILQLNVKPTITHKYLKRRYISDRMIYPYEDNLT
jgi:hypothetical protein